MYTAGTGWTLMRGLQLHRNSIAFVGRPSNDLPKFLVPFVNNTQAADDKPLESILDNERRVWWTSVEKKCWPGKWN